jgi:hypothetical protein
MREPDDAPLADDPTHPIPFLEQLDVYAVNGGGGATLVIVVASPLRADARSQERLLAKIEGYLGFINSEQFAAEAGAPSPENTEIVVSLHRRSAREIRELLERCRPWVEENNARLVVEKG